MEVPETISEVHQIFFFFKNNVFKNQNTQSQTITQAQRFFRWIFIIMNINF